MFLHGSQVEIRKVFLILIQKLPKANEQPLPESVGKYIQAEFIKTKTSSIYSIYVIFTFSDPLQQTLREIKSEILNQLNRPWLPYFCNGPPKKYVPFKTCDLSHLST